MISRLLTAIASVTTLTSCTAADPRTNVSPKLETPAYEVLAREGAFEVRRYAPYLVAQARVTGDRDTASRAGFRILAGYIFGKNKGKRRVAMTAPVAAERIAMTTPVAATQEGEAWTVSFMMPSRYTRATLPEPEDPRVQFAERPASCHAAVVFSGLTTDARVKEQETALGRWLVKCKLVASGPPVLARYNDPWTLPMNRRNEVLVPLPGQACDEVPAR